jgi:hypothetical protein
MPYKTMHCVVPEEMEGVQVKTYAQRHEIAGSVGDTAHPG